MIDNETEDAIKWADKILNSKEFRQWELSQIPDEHDMAGPEEDGDGRKDKTDT